MPTAADYQRGVEIAEARFGDECRDFDRAIWGMTEAVKAGGHDVDAMDFASRWHYPLAGANAQHNFDQWSRYFPSCMKGFEASVPYEVRSLLEGRDTFWKFRNADQHAAKLESADAIDREANEMIDREIKAKYEKVRRNTKRYRELADSVRDKARAIVREDTLEALKRELVGIRGWLAGEEAKRIREIDGHISGLRVKAADLQALNPACEVAAAMIARAAMIAERLATWQERLAAELAELEAAAGDVVPAGAAA